MRKIEKYTYYLYIALRIAIFLDIIFRTKDKLINLIIFTCLFGVIILNEHLRWKYFYKKVIPYYSSVFLNMILAFLLSIKVRGYIDIYFYVILYELISFTEGKISNIFIGIQFSLLISLWLIRATDFNYYNLVNILKTDALDFLMSLFMSLMGIFFYCLCLFTFKALRKEKRKVEQLNKELEISYNKLKEQSETIEELTITKERNRVAREIHDNLGHGLIALNMNLDVAEKTIDKDVERAKELIRKSQELVKESIENLRKAVYALKEKNPKEFIKSINKIVEDIENTGKVKVILNIEEKIESLPSEYKEILYFTIKESLTNSIKHGKADEIYISISIEEYVKLVVEDNGMGCKKLIKGNGLTGIENRIMEYDGKVFFINNMDNGFKIELLLPY